MLDSHLLGRSEAESDEWHGDSAEDDRAYSAGWPEVTDDPESPEELCGQTTIRARVSDRRFYTPEGIPMERGDPIQESGQVGTLIHPSFQSDHHSG